MLRMLGQLMIRSAGWKLDNDPPDLPKYVLIAAPHTSTWDAPLMVAMNYGSGLNGKWMVKESALRFPMRNFLLALGAVPVKRDGRLNVVQQMASELQTRSAMRLVISPEGTRAPGDHWKSGFYYIAVEANVPIVCTYLDYSRKRGGFGPVIYPTGDIARDFEKFAAFYSASMAKHPERFAPVRVQPTTSRKPDAAA